MSLILKAGLCLAGLSWCVTACVSTPPKKVLTLKEQIEVDTVRARDLTSEFEDRVSFRTWPKVESYLRGMASTLAQKSPTFEVEKLRIRIHTDAGPAGVRVFAFPGSLISIPEGFIRQVGYENELAALLALEMAHLIHRNLAKHVEEQALKPVPVPPLLFGSGSVFDFDRNERSASIRTGVRMLYEAGYDARGMASIFQRVPGMFGNPDSAPGKKEVEFNVREAQRAASDFLPVLKPIVRSPEFIQFKKELERNKP
jgi:predicted Zn-dependent protease